MPPKTLNSLNSKPQSLDLAALGEMAEPLTVQIDRVKGGQRSPIPLPINPANGEPAGVGWAKEEIQAIEQGWLVNDWAGGGLYVGKVTDSSTPPKTLEWKMFWNPADYPEKIPPTLQGAASPHLQVVPPLPQVQQVQQMASIPQFPGGLPTGGLLPHQQQPMPVYYGPQMPFQQPYQPANYGAQAAQQRIEDELARTREALNQQRLEAQAQAHASALERERTANQSAIQRLEQRIAELATVNARPTGPSPELVAMQEQLKLQAAQLENERRERESERRENALREQMRQQAEQTQRSIEAIQSQMAAQLAALSNKGQDPMINMIMEQNRNFTAALGEISRSAQAQSDKFQAFMMSPRDIIAMQKDSSNGLDGLTSKLTSVYSNVMDMQQRVIENAMQLNQGGSETVGLIREGITSVKEGFERYVGSKSKAEQVTQQSQAQATTANAQAAAIQAQANVEIARLQALGPVAAIQPQRPPQPVPQSGGLNGQPANGNGAPKGGASFEEWQRQQAAAQVINEASVAAQVPVEEPRYYGRTTLEWFTALAIAEVKAVRDGVDSFIAGLKAGRMEGGTPDQVVTGIMQAQMISSAQNIQIPAFVELLNQSKYEEFTNILIPNAPDQYKADVVSLLKQKIDGEVDDEDDDDDDDEDDDGTQSDDVRDGSAVPPPPKPAAGKRPTA